MATADPAALVVVIPAYQPGRALVDLVQDLAGAGMTVVVVDDGSGTQFRAIFDQIQRLDNVRVLRHAINLEKAQRLRPVSIMLWWNIRISMGW